MTVDMNRPVQRGVTDLTKRALPAPRLNGRIQGSAMATGTGFGHRNLAAKPPRDFSISAKPIAKAAQQTWR